MDTKCPQMLAAIEHVNSCWAFTCLVEDTFMMADEPGIHMGVGWAHMQTVFCGLEIPQTTF